MKAPKHAKRDRTRVDVAAFLDAARDREQREATQRQSERDRWPTRFVPPAPPTLPRVHPTEGSTRREERDAAVRRQGWRGPKPAWQGQESE